MRKLALLALAGMLLASAAYAQSTATTTYTQTVYPFPGGGQGTNLIALKGVPLEPDPLGSFDSDWNLVKAGVFWQGSFENTLPLIENGKLSKLNPVTVSQPGYSFDNPGAFGKCLLGEGYMMLVGDDTQHTLTYAGIKDGVPDATGAQTDMWISLPGAAGQNGGDHWIGNPFNHEVYFNDIKVTDGTKTIPVYSDDPAVETAISLGWLEGAWLYFMGANQNEKRVDPTGGVGSWNLWPGHMYLVKTFKSNIALIIPSAPSPYPDTDCDELY